MKRPIRFLKALFVLAIVFATALYVGRVRLGDLLREATAPELPEAVGYEEVVGGEAPVEDPEVAVGDVEGVENVDGGGSKPATTSTSEAEPGGSTGPPAATTPPAQTIPVSINLSVPFTSQAPTGNWDEVHEETCEESSAYMVAAFYKGVSGTIPADTAEAELQRLVAYELDTFGYYKDTTATETSRMILDEYGYRSDLLKDPTVDDIKTALAAGHPVIIPAAGRELGNPYFTAPGPVYHMFVIRGYSGDRFIVNDPGTRHGEAYTYPIDTVMNSIHDWNAENIDLGGKVVIVVRPG